VPDLEEALRRLELAPVHEALRRLLDSELVASFAETGHRRPLEREATAIVAEAGRRLRSFLVEGRRVAGRSSHGISEARGDGAADLDEAIRGFERRLEAALQLAALEAHFPSRWPHEVRAVLPTADSTSAEARATWGPILAWGALEALGNFCTVAGSDRPAVQLIEALRLREPMAVAFQALGREGEDRWRATARVRAAFVLQAPQADRVPEASRAPDLLQEPLDPDVAWLIGVHVHEGVRYVAKEPLEQLLWWRALPRLLDLATGDEPDTEALGALESEIASSARAAAAAGYRLADERG
jgi:hypothetical protein